MIFNVSLDDTCNEFVLMSGSQEVARVNIGEVLNGGYITVNGAVCKLFMSNLEPEEINIIRIDDKAFRLLENLTDFNTIEDNLTW